MKLKARTKSRKLVRPALKLRFGVRSTDAGPVANAVGTVLSGTNLSEERAKVRRSKHADLLSAVTDPGSVLVDRNMRRGCSGTTCKRRSAVSDRDDHGNITRPCQRRGESHL
jgi:hypothetical protein